MLTANPRFPKQKKRETSFLNNKEEKRRIRQSFEKQIPVNEEFDDYIKRQFNKMIQQKNQNPILNIPTGFQKFIESKAFKQLLKKIYIYMEALVDYEKRFKFIDKKQGDKISSDPLFKALRSQTEDLTEKCKEISFAYMGILLGYGDNKMVFKDQYFFETMIYFLTRVLSENFDGEDFNIVDEELNRIFRTDAFNLIKRRQMEDEIYRKHPALKESKYDGSIDAVFKLESRLSIQKKHHYSVQIRSDRPRRLTKPIDLHLSTFHSVRSRSPLIATYYPSERQKLFSFTKQLREQQSFFKSNPYENSNKKNFNIRKQQSHMHI